MRDAIILFGLFLFQGLFYNFLSRFLLLWAGRKTKVLRTCNDCVDGCPGMAKNLTKGDGIVQFTNEDCKMAVGLANRRRLAFSENMS